MKIAQGINDSNDIEISFTNLGAAYNKIGDLVKAASCYERASKIAYQNDSKEGQVVSFGGLGNVYFNRGDFRKSVEYYESASRTISKIENTDTNDMKAELYLSPGKVYEVLGDHRKAIRYQNMALKLVQEQNSRIISLAGDVYAPSVIRRKHIEEKVYVNLGISYSNMKAYPKAIKYLNKSIEIAQATNDM